MSGLFILSLIIVLLAAPLAIGINLLSSKKLIHLGRILIMLPVLAGIFLATCFVLLLVLFSTTHQVFYSTAIIVLGILAAVFCGCALWGVLKKKYVRIPLCSLLAVCVLVMCGFGVYQRCIDSIPTVSENNNLLTAYAPYEANTKVAQLDEASTLTINSDFPKMDGATALYPIYSAFAKAVYPKEILNVSPYRNDYLDCTTTTRAYKKIVTGDADIIFAAPPSEEQKKFAADSGVELVYTPIGTEAFVFFVNSKNPIDNLTAKQIQDIYSGKITDWDELGADKLGKIRAFQRNEGSGSQSALVRFMNGKELMTPPKEDVVDVMSGIISRTSDYKNYKNAIGYSFRFYSTEMVQNNKIKHLSINGVSPTPENIENGTYPIASEFYAVTRSDASENTKKLLDWILSKQGQELIETTGYTPLNKLK